MYTVHLLAAHVAPMRSLHHASLCVPAAQLSAMSILPMSCVICPAAKLAWRSQFGSKGGPLNTVRLDELMPAMRKQTYKPSLAEATTECVSQAQRRHQAWHQQQLELQRQQQQQQVPSEAVAR